MGSLVLIAQPSLHGVLAAFFGVIALVGVLALVVGHYTRKETVKGEVVARDGFTATVSERAGTVSTIAIKLGDRVEAGQLLAVVQIPRVVAGSGDTAELTIARYQEMRRNLDLRARALQVALAAVPAQVAQINTNADTSLRSAAVTRASTLKQHELASERLAATETLAARGFASRIMLDQAQNTLLQADQARASAELTALEIERARSDRLMSIKADVRATEQALLDVENQKIQIDTQIHDVQANEFVRITAPTAGEILLVNVRQGQRIDPGDRLFAIAKPGSSLAISLEVPSGAIGFIKTGQRVVLKYDAFPFQAYGLRYGRVSAVHSAAIGSAAQATDPTIKPGKAFLVEVLPDQSYVKAHGSLRPLRIGMGVTAEVALERRSLISWFLEPLYSIQGQLR